MILMMIMNHLIIWILLGLEAWEMEEGSKEMYVFHGENIIKDSQLWNKYNSLFPKTCADLSFITINFEWADNLTF